MILSSHRSNQARSSSSNRHRGRSKDRNYRAVRLDRGAALARSQRMQHLTDNSSIGFLIANAENFRRPQVTPKEKHPKKTVRAHKTTTPRQDAAAGTMPSGPHASAAAAAAFSPAEAVNTPARDARKRNVATVETDKSPTSVRNLAPEVPEHLNLSTPTIGPYGLLTIVEDEREDEGKEQSDVLTKKDPPAGAPVLNVWIDAPTDTLDAGDWFGEGPDHYFSPEQSTECDLHGLSFIDNDNSTYTSFQDILPKRPRQNLWECLLVAVGWGQS